MILATECAPTIQNERELQGKNERLRETLKQYGVDPKPEPGATLWEENQRLRQLLQRTWISFWGVDRWKLAPVENDEINVQKPR
jgi:hypothetical protein